jgi:hypothetical protein
MPSRGLPPLAPPKDKVCRDDAGFLPRCIHDDVRSTANRRDGANGWARTPNEAMNSAEKNLMMEVGFQHCDGWQAKKGVTSNFVRYVNT